MSEPGSTLESPAGRSAGSLLRQARKAQGLHIAALAAAIKVTPQKLEALESDRYDELPDATFARALAKAVCRVLKIDAEPVLAMLPKNVSQGFERLGGGLNTPYRERPGRSEGVDLSVLRSPVLWIALLLVIGAAALMLMPPIDWMSRFRHAEVPATAEPAASAPIAAEPGLFASSPVVVVPPVIATESAVPAISPSASTPEGIAPAPTPGGDTTPAGLITLLSKKDSWVEVVDSQGHTLISRTLKDEQVALDGTPPFRVKVGNALNMQITFRGQPVDLKPATRDNIARLELK